MIWTSLHWIDRVLFWVLLGFLIWSFFSKGGRRGKAKVRTDGQVEFRPNRIWFCFWGVSATWAPLAVASWLHGHHSTILDFAIPTCCCLIAIGFFFEAPQTIVMNEEGLRQVYWLRGNKRIRWSEIAEIKTALKRGAVTIIGENGSEIVHTFMLVDRPRLLLEIREHCGDELPADFPKEALSAVAPKNL
jgi:hypothetical protein